MENIFKKIKNKIDLNQTVQPILFLWNNFFEIDLEINKLKDKLFLEYWVDDYCFFEFKDNWEKIKVEEIRDFMKKSNTKSSFKFQIFLIKNIWRFTHQSANSVLKFLEEPWVWNIIFLTNTSESWILETILSRVIIKNIYSKKTNIKNEFYFDMIDWFLKQKNDLLYSYFFDDKKLEKQNYIDFFDTFFLYISSNLEYFYLADDILKSVNLIKNNNVLPKYEIDKLILKISLNKND